MHPKLNLGNKVGGGTGNTYLHMLKIALVCTSSVAHQVEGGGKVRSMQKLAVEKAVRKKRSTSEIIRKSLNLNFTPIKLRCPDAS